MLLALIIPAFLSPSFLPTIFCEYREKGDLSRNKSLNFPDLILTPFEPVSPTSKLRLLQIEHPHYLSVSNRSISKYKLLKDIVKRENNASKLRSNRNSPPRMPKVKSNSKDYGASSHYRMKGARESSKKGYYMNILRNLLHKPRTSKKEYSNGYESGYALQKMSAMSAPGWGGGWHGWMGKGWGGGGHGHGYSLLELLLCGLSLLSLGGFLLNLLLNLLNLFGFGMMTSTATYPVTITSTQTGGTVTGGITVPTLASAASGGSGLGFTGRTIDSLAGNGWNGSPVHLGIHIKLPHKGWGWSSTTTTTTVAPTGGTAPTLTGILPTVTGGITGGITGGGGVSGGITVGRGFTAWGQKRTKRETFEPYVDPTTALEVFSKSILDSINSAMNKYECMQYVVCENNKRARIIGQWLDYFMPVYSLSVSYIGYRNGAHDSLLDHIRAIVLGATETNCQAHFPRCEEVKMEKT